MTTARKASSKASAESAKPAPAAKMNTKTASTEAAPKPAAKTAAAKVTKTKAAPKTDAKKKTAAKAPPKTKAPAKAAAKAKAPAAPKAEAAPKAARAAKSDVKINGEVAEPFVNGVPKDAEDTKTDAPLPNGVPEVVKTKAIKRKGVDDDVAPPAPKKARVVKPKPAINAAPTEKLNVFVFGEGSSGELGLGTARRAIDVKRPRLNPFLLPDEVGVTQIAAGGMHVAALTHDNRILTWGVNDQGALGRDTKWAAPAKDANAGDDSEDEEDDNGLNPRESTPTAVDPSYFPEGTVFTQIAAGDSCTFVVTADGSVYGWGTFRNNEGILGFTQKIFVQFTPMLIPELKKIKYIATGSNHALALDHKGSVYAWGSGQQNQLGRRVVERTRTNGLVPRELGVRGAKFTMVAAGTYHSFAVDTRGRVWAWGLNNYCETAITAGAGEEAAVIPAPTVVDALRGQEIIDIKGGGHHSLAVTAKHDCLVWGRVDGHQVGMELDSLPKDDVVSDDRNHPRILTKPTAVPGLKAAAIATAVDTCIAITPEGRAYSWGFSENYQTGQGTGDDVEVATLIDNTATREKKLNMAGIGGQYAVLTSVA